MAVFFIMLAVFAGILLVIYALASAAAREIAQPGWPIVHQALPHQPLPQCSHESVFLDGWAEDVTPEVQASFEGHPFKKVGYRASRCNDCGERTTPKQVDPGLTLLANIEFQDGPPN